MAILIDSFAPLIGDGASHLILGSMPGQASLDAHQYYAHPRNAFWPIMTQVFAWPSQLSYAERSARLRAEGIAVWDVLARCERPGSLDTAIKIDSIICNPIAELLASQRSIHSIILNGATADRLFRRHILPGLANPTLYALLRMPSTSPAHASLSLAEKCRIWEQALRTGRHT